MNETKVKYRQPSLMRGFILAAISLILTIASISLVTFALFIREEGNNTMKVQAGELAINLYIKKTTGTEIDTNSDATNPNYGKLKPVNQTWANTDSQKDYGTLLNDYATDLFVIEDAVPTQKQKSLFIIENYGSVAATYEIKIADLKINPDAVTEIETASTRLSEQILVRVSYTNADGVVRQVDGKDCTIEYTLSAFDADDTLSLNIPTVGLNELVYFTVEWEFLDSDDQNYASYFPADPGYVNNDAMNGVVRFDITVIATQDTGTVNP